MSDLDGGKRSGNLADFRDLVRLTQHFDVLHVTGPCVEPQDVPVQFRHLQSGLAYLTLTDKVPYLYARGRGQVADGFEMFRIGYGVDRGDVRLRPALLHGDQQQLAASARHPDVHGADRLRRRGAGLDRSRRSRWPGAMAPVTLAGALTLQHAEALAGVVLTQAVRPGAPVVYGAFTSNVDMKSGAPAFGTPEYFKAAIASGQLARHVGLPYRSSAPNASNAVDAQAMYETMMSLFGARPRRLQRASPRGRLARGRADRVEGEVHPRRRGPADARRDLPAARRRRRRRSASTRSPTRRPAATSSAAPTRSSATAPPSTSRSSPTGPTSASGPRRGRATRRQRANETWKRILAEFEPPPLDDAIAAELAEFVARRTAEGGAPPES